MTNGTYSAACGPAFRITNPLESSLYVFNGVTAFISAVNFLFFSLMSLIICPVKEHNLETTAIPCYE